MAEHASTAMKSIICFVLTALLWVLSGILISKFLKSVSEKADSNLALIEAPNSAVFTVLEGQDLTVWHDYQTIYNGTTISNDSALPGGFSFELKAVGSPHPIPFIGSGMSSSMQVGTTYKSKVGSFSVPGPGDYELVVGAPAGESRLVSVSQGSVLQNFGSLFGLMSGAMGAMIAGVVTLILGFLFLFTGKKKSTSPPPLNVA